MLRILTDSTASLPPELAQEKNIEVVPCIVVFPDGAYRDGVDLSTEDFYRKLVISPEQPTTSQPPVSVFEQFFERLTANGDRVLAIMLASTLSATFSSAEMARRNLPGRDITVFDSCTAVGPQRLMAEHAAMMAQMGKSLENILEDLKVLRDRAVLFFVLDTLEYLRRGGRIGRAAALAGTLLQIKPVLALQQGVVEVVAKIRGKRKALQTVLDTLRQAVGVGDSVRALVLHAASEDEAREFAREVQAELRCPPPLIGTISPVVGVHVGPGGLGVAAYNEEWFKTKT